MKQCKTSFWGDDIDFSSFHLSLMWTLCRKHFFLVKKAKEL